MLHIGEKIKEVFDNTNLKVVEFAKRLNTTRENVYDIFKRKSIDTQMLHDISQILNYDFFQLYLNPNTKDELKKELEEAKKEIEYLKKINILLEKENKYQKRK